MCETLNLDDLQYSDKYAEFIMSNSKGDPPIGNGDMLIEAMEDAYMWEDFLISIGAKE
jgi:hypothetical protein